MFEKFKYKFLISFSIRKNGDSVTSDKIWDTLSSVTFKNSDLSETKQWLEWVKNNCNHSELWDVFITKY